MQILKSVHFDRLILYFGSVLFLFCAALFAYLGNPVFIAAPFLLFIVLWVLINFKSFYWFFLFCIPLSFEYTIPGTGLSTTIPDEQIMWAFVPLVLLIVAHNYKLLPDWFLKHPLTLVLFLQFIWMIVAVIYAQNHVLALKYTAAKIWFLNAFFILPILIFRNQNDLAKGFKVFVIPVVLHAFVAFGWHYLLGFGFSDSNVVVKPFYVNHVDYSTILSMIFPLLLVAFQLAKGQRKKRILIGFIILFFIPAIYFAYARAAMLAVVFSLGIALAIRWKLVNWVMPVFYVIIFSVAALLIHNDNYLKFRPDYEHTYTQRTFSDLITATFRGTDMSSMERFYRWIASVRMSTEHPVVGVGPNNFYDHYKGHTVSQFKTYVSRNEEKSTTHNYFLFMLVEQGWPAMILYGVLIFIVFATAQKIYHRTSNNFYKKACMGIIMMFAAGFINNFFSELLETHKIGALFYMSISLLIVLDQLTKKEARENGKQLI